MSFKSFALAAVASLVLTSPALAESKIMIKDAYARVASKAAKAGAAFLEIHNMGDTDDRLISVSTDIAVKNELHTHKDIGDGVMKMLHVEEGFVIPAGGSHVLARGGDHVMFMGLNTPLDHGDEVKAVLVFEQAGEIEVTIPVDLERKAMHGGHGEHDKDAHSDHDHH
ncbi:copper chaperone PCu(A)C [Cognatishimia activa]|uniref:copper chaperone PCu(A)C n=1 Tax=Cognatishimia activa TaxID=1715691 RepID=UPI002231EFAC|nr:copper chaperone PCu(A)C [Cognatishimia activa]UZD89812.1 copper chaperone PCu(A)C [Cognatishimia activa]